MCERERKGGSEIEGEREREGKKRGEGGGRGEKRRKSCSSVSRHGTHPWQKDSKARTQPQYPANLLASSEPTETDRAPPRCSVGRREYCWHVAET